MSIQLEAAFQDIKTATNTSAKWSETSRGTLGS